MTNDITTPTIFPARSSTWKLLSGINRWVNSKRNDIKKKYLTNYGTSIFKPELASDIFNADDMVNPNDLADKTSTFYSDLRKNSTHFPKVSTLWHNRKKFF